MLAVTKSLHTVRDRLLTLSATDISVDVIWRSALSIAAFSLCEASIQSLLDHGAGKTYRNIHKDTPLTYAIKKRNVEIIGLYLRDSTFVNMICENDVTPLMLVVNVEALHPVRDRLLALQASVHSVDTKGYTALTHATIGGNLSSIKALIAHDAKPEQKNSKGLSPIIVAANMGKTHVIDALIASMAEDIKLAVLTEVLFHVARLRNIPVLEYLLNLNIRGLNGNVTDPQGQTLLFIFTKAGNNDYATRLLDEFRANPNIADRKGCTPLMVTCTQNNVALALILLQHNALTNLTDEHYGYSALHLAVFANSQGCVSELLKRDASIDLLDENQQTPLVIATINANSPLARCLLLAGAILF